MSTGSGAAVLGVVRSGIRPSTPPTATAPAAARRKPSTTSNTPSTRSIDFASDRSPLQKLELELKHISQGEADAEGVVRSLSRRKDGRLQGTASSPTTARPDREDSGQSSSRRHEGRSPPSSRRHRHHLEMSHIFNYKNSSLDEDQDDDRHAKMKGKVSHKSNSGAEDPPESQPTYDAPPSHPAALESNTTTSHRRFFFGHRKHGESSRRVSVPSQHDGGHSSQPVARLTLEDRVFEEPEIWGVGPNRNDQHAPEPKTFTPPLSVRCGPLLRYTGLRRDDTPRGERETWRGSVMIVTNDGSSTYSPGPILRLYYVSGRSAAGENSTEKWAEGKHKEVSALALHAENGVSFWRFNLEVEMADTESKIAYRINQGPPIHFWIPAVGQTMNIMFHSCNGFSLSVNPDDFCGPDPMWADVLRKHAENPFHVMLGGGDQIYNDAVSRDTVHFRRWIAIKTPFQKSAHAFTEEISAELDDFYLQRYSMWFAQGLFGVANSQIPMVNIWDDHDIIDGFGSYPNHFNRCPVFAGLGAVAMKYYMLFQHQSTVHDLEEDEPSWLLGNAPGPYINELSRSTFMFLGRSVAFLGLDCRTERMRTEVVSSETYEKVFRRLRKEIIPGETKHLIVLLGVPIAYPRLVWLENLLTSRIMDPLKALGRMGLLGGFLNNFDGGVEILDDLDDHWTAKNHKKERNRLIRSLQELAVEHSVRISILGGDVHVAGIGQFMSNPKLNIPRVNDHRYMPNIISSAIVNTPPPNTMADILNKRNKVHHLDADTDEDMFPIFLTDVDNSSRNNKRLLPRRNYCIIGPYNPDEDVEPELRPVKETQLSKLMKAATFKKSVDKLSRQTNFAAQGDGAVESKIGKKSNLLREGLAVTLRMEVSQKDPSGATKPYRFTVPALRCERP